MKQYIVEEDFKLNDEDFLKRYKEVVESHGEVYDEDKLYDEYTWRVEKIPYHLSMEHLEENCLECTFCEIIYNKRLAKEK